jgi:transposase
MPPVLTGPMDILTDSHQVRRIDLVESGRRRRWTESAKLKIVQESLAGPRLTAATARRHGISRQLLLNWRKAWREGRLGGDAEASGFVPAVVTSEPARTDERSLPQHGRVEIVTANGRRLIVGPSIDIAALLRLVRGLEQL